MGEIRSIYGKPFLIDPDAAPTSADRKWPDPDVGTEILTDTQISYSREHFAAEWEQMRSRTWNLAGRCSEAIKHPCYPIPTAIIVFDVD